MAEEETDIKFHSTFERKGEFIALQAQLLSKPLDVEPTPDEQHAEAQVLQQLSLIFDVYQEQNYLWDRYLESLVLPVVDAVKAYAKDSVANPTREWSSPRVRHLSHLLHNYARFRGYKAIIRYFPHEIADLSIALDFILLPNGLAQEVANQWALRYAILIWLSLICMIPFDLAQFDEVETPGKTASSLELVAKQFLGKAGLEREAASLLLSRLYIRADGKALFQEFLTWSSELIQSTAVDPFLCIGILRVFSEVAKSGSADQVVNNTQKLLDITKIIEEKDTLFGNTIIRKMRMKLFSRVALRALPPRYLRRRGRELVGVGTTEHHPEESGDETPVPDVVETVLAELFEGLHDRDTLIRYSSAKGVARISERLSMDNVDDVLENIMSSFETHSAGVARIYDMPAIAESTWHGACLACAEMARRSLVSPDKLPKLIEWLSQALYFDLRKGAHSIGSNVRDAAAYVLWALARTQGHSALVKYANELASRLVTVALFDREIPIRRAASAAFQEYVGRTGLFPHGIDVLRKTDFYVVSIRKNAFLVAAPQVAEHPEYRSFLFDHLLDVSIRHWDISMRQLASQSLRLICSVDLPDWAPKAMARVSSLLESIDVVDVHGALLALTELAIAYKESGSPEDVAAPLRNIHNYLSHVSQEVLYAPRNEIITAEACRLLASAITSDEIVASSKSENPPWLKLLDSGLKHKAEIVQIEAANALREITRMADCTDLIRRMTRELKLGSFVLQQNLGRLLGAVDYLTHSGCLEEATNCLLECVDPSNSRMKSNVEARRNCYLAIPKILATCLPKLSELLSSQVVTSLYEALQQGLSDYTTDERGDVGSWIRIACIQGLTTISEMLSSNGQAFYTISTDHDDTSPACDLRKYLPPRQYHKAANGILKQGVERLDNVRQEAGEAFTRLMKLQTGDRGPNDEKTKGTSEWDLPGFTILDKLFLQDTEDSDWGDGRWLFPKAIHLLDIPEYRDPVLSGLIISLGSRSQSTHKPLADSLLNYVGSLPTLGGDGGSPRWSVKGLVEELLSRAKPHFTHNASVIPILNFINTIIDGEGMRNLASSGEEGVALLSELLGLASRNATRLKSVVRIQETMKIIVTLATYPELFKMSVNKLHPYLGHPYPTIRSETAEYLYLSLQGTEWDVETDDVEEILLETAWSTESIEDCLDASKRIVQLLLL